MRIKLIVIMLMFWLINTTMTHLVAKAGLIHGVQPTKETKLRKG